MPSAQHDVDVDVAFVAALSSSERLGARRASGDTGRAARHCPLGRTVWGIPRRSACQERIGVDQSPKWKTGRASKCQCQMSVTLRSYSGTIPEEFVSFQVPATVTEGTPGIRSTSRRPSTGGAARRARSGPKKKHRDQSKRKHRPQKTTAARENARLRLADTLAHL